MLWTELLQITKVKIAKSNNISGDGSFPALLSGSASFPPQPREVSSRKAECMRKGVQRRPASPHAGEPRNSLCARIHLYRCGKIQRRLALKSKQAASAAAPHNPNQQCLRVFCGYCPASFLLRHLPFHVALLQQAGSTGEKPFH